MPLVLKEILDTQEQLDLMDHVVLPVKLASQESLVPKVPRDPLVLPDLLVTPDSLDRLETEEERDPPDLVVLL